jgi:hypothetical protein
MKRCLVGATLFLSFFLVISNLAAQETTDQSLADLARKERERKKDQPKPAKVITTEDVAGKGGGQESPHNPTALEKSAAEANAPPSASDATREAMPPKVVNTPSPAVSNVDEGKKQSNRLELSADEQHALRVLAVLAVAEEACRTAMGAYAPIDIMRNGCSGRLGGGSYRFTPRKELDPQNDEKYQYFMDLVADTCQIHADPIQGQHAGFYYDGDDVYFNPTGRASKEDSTLRSDQILDLVKQGSAAK